MVSKCPTLRVQGTQKKFNLDIYMARINLHQTEDFTLKVASCLFTMVDSTKHLKWA